MPTTTTFPDGLEHPIKLWEKTIVMKMLLPFPVVTVILGSMEVPSWMAARPWTTE